MFEFASLYRRKRWPTTMSARLRAFYPRCEQLEERIVPGAGQLDPTFGTGGLVSTRPDGARDIGRSVVIQPDGKILVVGDSEGPVTYVLPAVSHSTFDLTRYNSDGSLDTTFGIDGRVKTPFDLPAAHADKAVLLADGKILVAGNAYFYSLDFGEGGFTSIAYQHAVLAKYNRDGSLDTTFGDGGKVIVASDARLHGISDLIVQPDGKIIALGGVLARFNADGRIDTTFGVNGFAESGGATHAALLANGQIVAAGGWNWTALCRFDSSGQLLQTGGGIFPSDGMAMQADGKIVFVGSPVDWWATTERFIFTRLNADFSPDTDFGTNGTVQLDAGSGRWPRSVAAQPDGKIVAVGINDISGELVVARLNADGSRDTTFGDNGVVTTGFPGGIWADANDVALQPDGKIVAAGWNGGFAVARFLGNDTPPSSGGGGERMSSALFAFELFGSGLDSTNISNGKSTNIFPEAAGLARGHGPANSAFDPAFLGGVFVG